MQHLEKRANLFYYLLLRGTAEEAGEALSSIPAIKRFGATAEGLS